MRVSPEMRISYTQIVVNLSVPRTEIDSRTHACFASINFVQGSSLHYDHSLRSGKELHPLETAEGHFAAPPNSFRITIPVKKASPHGQNDFLTKWNLTFRLFLPLRPSFTWMEQSVSLYLIFDRNYSGIYTAKQEIQIMTKTKECCFFI